MNDDQNARDNGLNQAEGTDGQSARGGSGNISAHGNVKRHRRPKRKKIHVWRWVWGAIAVILLSFGGYIFYLYHNLSATVDKTYIAAGNEKKNQDAVDARKPISILLLGTDTGGYGRTEALGRTDTIILVTLNPDKKKATMTSIPRDTIAQMMGTRELNVQKINAAYSIGGASMTMDTVSALLNVPINYYAAINMGGLKTVVDSVGGIDVDVPFDFTNMNYNFKKGPMHLNGDQTLAYVRMRYTDPENDYGRQKRQQQAILAILDAAPSLTTLSNYQAIMNEVQQNFRSNISLNNMVSIYNNYKGTLGNLKQDQMVGTGAMIKGSSYQIPSTQTLQKFSDEVRTNLGLKTVPLSNEVTRQNALNTGFNWEASSNPEYVIYDHD